MRLRALATEIEMLTRWLLDRALPLWSETGCDPLRGGFHEKLAPDGTPVEEPRRARVAARQVYVFSVAARLGWPGDKARPMLDHALGFLFRHHLPEDGIVVASVTPEGRVLRADFDLYDHAFVLFALAEAGRVVSDPGPLAARARALRETMRQGWAHPLGGFEESQPPSLPLRSNPHMHLLEAALAWEEVSSDPGWSRMADALVRLSLAQFFDPQTGALHEYFDADWAALQSPPEDVVEPGHQFEWSWLLARWARRRGDVATLEKAHQLAALGERYGVDPAQDLAVNELNADLSVRDGRFRLWPQTERLKVHAQAMAMAPDPSGRAAAAALAARSARGLRRHLDHPLAGAWWEHLGRDGTAFDRSEPARTSSLYHIVCAIAEARDQLAALQPGAAVADKPSASRNVIAFRRNRTAQG
ncbi:mannose-6-phosphate isomerase type 3 [Rhodobacter viridis]|uniref:Mannose-6-phosphate isomerase type 3 n=1 Tax=Rhodobacter viridis TaxID=1054202 RepID=A0A318TRJ2_9RHOB|nr:AGE family epimerase/isomerase [Rhodobacter viridis]PYF07462.1 mannose-6-phosphate isomerase type 3 [Rhodobacter viridis]